MNDSITVQCSKGQLSAVQCSGVVGGDFSIHLTFRNARVRGEWMDAPRFVGGVR